MWCFLYSDFLFDHCTPDFIMMAYYREEFVYSNNKKKVYSNSTNIKKINNHLSPQLIDHKKKTTT
jgi:hypothetical protein